MTEKSLVVLEQENLELKKENTGLQETVTALLQQLERLREIDKRPTVTGDVTRVAKTTEEDIIEDQIKRLDEVSRQRMFSLEETRALDLLIKNKRLLDPNKPIEPDYTKVPEGQTESDLLRIAGNAESEVDTSTNKERKSRTKTSSKNSMA